jgi:hypothetical protein
MIEVDLGFKRFNAVAKAIAKDCVSFYKLPKNIGVDISADCIDNFVSGAADAACFRGDDDLFFIIINEELMLSEQRLMELVAHEMTHIKQWVKGELQDIADDKVLYKGKVYSNETDLDYWLAPWEMEARAMQEFFVFRYENR